MSGFVVNVIGVDADRRRLRGLGDIRELSPGFAYDIAVESRAALDEVGAFDG